MYPAHGNDDDYFMVEAEPLPEDPAKTLANALYSAKKPEAKRVRLGRKDGQPISRPENLYPDGYPDADYVVVEIPPGKSRRKTPRTGTPYRTRFERFFLCLCAPPPVIPAKAGIYTDDKRSLSEALWIPAFAGMTGRGAGMTGERFFRLVPGPGRGRG